MQKLYKEYLKEIYRTISLELNVPVKTVERVLLSTYNFYREKMWEPKFDDAIKIKNIGKFIPTIMSKKMKGIIPKKLKNNEIDNRND